jgi:DNA/RNA endonuclease YhcR with UshA esterase domain
MIRRRAIVLQGLLVAAALSVALADEPQSIGEIRASVDSYHLKEVTIHGTVQHLTTLEPYTLPSGLICQGAYRFALEDDTGTIELIVPGWCGKQLPREVTVADGDRVSVRAEFHAPGRGSYSLDLKGRKLEAGDADQAHGIAKTITHLGQ